MASPSNLIGPLVVLILSIPLALLAAVTTYLATLALLLRVSVVYFELGIALVRSWIFAPTNLPMSASPASYGQKPNTVSKRHRRNSSSNRGIRLKPSNLDTSMKSKSYVALVGSSAPNRDFEGVGGWRDSDDVNDDDIWLSMNSRLELPTPGAQHAPIYVGDYSPSVAFPDHPRRHRRSLTSQSQRPQIASPGASRTSPVERGPRTPSVESPQGTRSPEGYFNMKTDLRLMSAEEMVTKVRMDERRASIGSSNGLGYPVTARTSKTNLFGMNQGGKA